MTAKPARSSRARIVARLNAVASVMLGALVLAPVAFAAPPTNDAWQQPFNAAVNSFPVTLAVADNSQATIQENEPLTSLGPGTCGTRKMVGTTWYRILGNGGVISVNTTGSNYDTVIAAYVAPTPLLNDGLPCNDDAAAGVLTSAISFQSTAGAAYLIQVGGCDACGGGSVSTGDLVMNITASEPPPPPPPPPVVVTPPPPPDADGDGIPDTGADKCLGSKPTRDINKDGCQDKPQRILANLDYNFSSYRQAGVIRGIALRKVTLSQVPKGARVRVTCRGCLKAAGRGRTARFRSFSFTAKRSGVQSMRKLNLVLIPRRVTLKVVVTAPERLGRRILVTPVKAGRKLDPRESKACLAVGSPVKRVPCSTGS